MSRNHAKHIWGPIPSVAGMGDASFYRGRTEKKRKRKSRWEAVSEDGQGKEGVGGAKSSQALVLFPGEVVLSNGLKINLPVALTGRHESGRPELVKLYTELAEVERQIRAGEFVDTRPEQERSPSPPPIYDAHGVRLNTREVRMKEKMGRMRNTLIEGLIKEDPKYVVPPDYKPEKKVRKVPLELAQMGLVIGPRGNTQRRMQDESNTRISIRGRGSGSREGGHQPHGGHYGQAVGPPQPYAQGYNQYSHQGYGGYQDAPPLPDDPIPGPPDDVPPPPPPM